MHRFLTDESYECFAGVPPAQVLADIAEIETVGHWATRPDWAVAVAEQHRARYASLLPVSSIIDKGFRYCADELADVLGAS